MSRLRAIPVLLVCMGPAYSHAQSGSSFVNTNIFEPVSTPAHDVHALSLFVLLITAGIFLGMSGLLIYALVRYRSRPGETMEPPQVFGSTQIELAWTIIPILLITVLFLGTARVIFCDPGCAEAGDCAGRDRGGTPVLVGVPLSEVRRGDGE